VPEHSATVASFYLDTFEVTVGRFRKFWSAFTGTPPSHDAAAHPLIPGSGWQSGWNGNLASSQATLTVNLKCDPTRQTWTDAAGPNEMYPINCVSWYEAFAFCAWDGGRLATEAEWEYAAAGGEANRLFPWGSDDPSVNIARANDQYSAVSPLIAVGSHPTGKGRWGHQDLAGSMWEWGLDWGAGTWYSGAGAVCSNCANLTASAQRVARGGSWNFNSSRLRAAYRGYFTPTSRANDVGFRCARTQ
jgi:formylglycine-generating enzyme